MKTKTRWRVGTFTETKLYIDKVEERYHNDCYQRDGDRDCARVSMNRDTNKPILGDDGFVQVVYPWLLSDIFFVPIKKS